MCMHKVKLMKQVSNFLFVVLLLAGFPLLAGAEDFHGTTRYSVGADMVPSCGNDQVLTYSANGWECKDNYVPQNCLGNQAIQTITADGQAVCAPFSFPAVQACDPHHGIKKIKPDGSVVCAKFPDPPKCTYPDVLTSDNGTYVCSPGTQFYLVPVATLNTFFAGCNAGNVNNSVGPWPAGSKCTLEPSIPHCPGDGIAAFSASCTLACAKYCKTKPDASNAKFNSGTITEYNEPLKKVGCTCLK